MAILLILLAIMGGVVVGDCWWRTPPRAVSPCCTTRSSATARASVGHGGRVRFVVGLLVVWLVSMRRTRRVRRRQLRTAERDLTLEVAELERDNASLREALAQCDPPLPRPGATAMPADLGTASTAPTAERRAARLRSDLDL